MNGIERTQTEEEKRDFVQLKDKRTDPKDKFIVLVHEKKAEANKKGLPFCDKAAIDEWMEHYRLQAQKMIKQYGYIVPEQIKDHKVDFGKYSDLKNFTLDKETRVLDKYLSGKLNREVFVKSRVYKFKGYEATKYTVQEPYEGAWDSKKA